MDNIAQLATFKALEESRTSRNVGLLDHFLLQEPESGQKLGLKRVVFETHSLVSERLDSVCNVLRVSKREFLEAATIDAMDKAEREFSSVFRDATGREFGDLVEG